MTIESSQPVCLTIAGVDPSGGAGIVADIKTFAAFGCFSAAAVTSLTFQNTQGVFGAAHQTAETIRLQIEPVLDDLKVSAVKTGMLPTREIIEEVSRLIRNNGLKNIVVDPVVRSTSGFDLIDDAALSSLVEMLFPLADLITPNLPEAERIAKLKIKNESDIRRAAKIMQDFGAKNVLIKGGHAANLGFERIISEVEKLAVDVETSVDESFLIKVSNCETGIVKSTDYLFVGDKEMMFTADYIETTSTHGTGCTLASAITANLALGKTLEDSVKISKKYVTEAIRSAPNIGKGNGPINHFARID